MKHFLQGVKHVLLYLLCFSGVLWVLAAIRMRNRAIVLTYHRVLPRSRLFSSFSNPNIVVTSETFEWQMRLVRRFLRPISTRDFLESMISGRPIPSRTCLITFDDGWYDNLQYALPIMREHDIPCIVFVATNFIGTKRRFWQESVARLLFETRHHPRTKQIIDQYSKTDDCFASDDAIRTKIYDVLVRLKREPPSSVDTLLEELGALAHQPLSYDEDRFLSWDELSQLDADELVSIGSHATSHTPLTRMSLEQSTFEMRQSKSILEDRLGHPIAVLAYPNGDWNPDIAERACKVRYSAAFTTTRGYVQRNSDLSHLPRYNISEPAAGTLPRFLGRLAGLT